MDNIQILVLNLSCDQKYGKMKWVEEYAD